MATSRPFSTPIPADSRGPRTRPRGSSRALARRVLVGLAAVFLAAPMGPAWATVGESFPDLTEMSLEALMDLQVTSVSKRAERLSDAAAAVFVITAEDIRRSGVTTIPDALRMVPGVQVGRIDANKWAITARGFNGRFANKLLVLMDGRSVYTPLFSGVYWDVQDTLLEDIDRIEVIRGPGATLWGANAVNGVINIITKSAQETRGGLMTGGIGTAERGFASGRYGAAVGETGAYRVYAKYFNRDGAVDQDGDDAADGWEAVRAGFRADWQPATGTELTVQGDLYAGNAGTTTTVPALVPPYTTTTEDDSKISGGNLLGRWGRAVSPSSEITFQTYYDRTRREEPGLLEETRDTFDLDFQHAAKLTSRHRLVWGVGYRVTMDDTEPGAMASADPDSRTDQLFSAFIQDDIVLEPDVLRLILGSKFEHNDYTGFEIQPTGRLVWTPRAGHTVWAAASRAVRTPSRGESDASFRLASIPPGTEQNPGSLPVSVEVEGSDDFGAERVIALESGYRLNTGEHFSLDLAGFVNFYDNLRSSTLGTPTPVLDPLTPHIRQPVSLANDMDGKGYGLELAAGWRALDWWQLLAAYTYLHLDLQADNAAGEEEASFFAGSTPKHQVSLRSQMDLPKDVELDLWLRYVDRLRWASTPEVGDYLTLDMRLGWRPWDSLELSLVGQNLLDDHHLEAVSETDSGVVPSEVERSVYAKLTWEF